MFAVCSFLLSLHSFLISFKKKCFHNWSDWLKYFMMIALHIYRCNKLKLRIQKICFYLTVGRTLFRRGPSSLCMTVIGHSWESKTNTCSTKKNSNWLTTTTTSTGESPNAELQEQLNVVHRLPTSRFLILWVILMVLNVYMLWRFHLFFFLCSYDWQSVHGISTADVLLAWCCVA